MLPFQVDDAATQITVAIVAAAVIWKIYFRGRYEVREDSRQGMVRVTEAHVTDAYEHLVDQLRSEVSRLATAVSVMSQEIDTERAARRTAELKASNAEMMAVSLTTRVLHLENMLIKHGIAF